MPINKIEIPISQADLFQKEFLDVLKVLEYGASKYSPDGWLNPDPYLAKFNHIDNTSSMFRHLAESYNKLNADPETGLDPLLHLACRALMAYCRKKRGLIY